MQNIGTKPSLIPNPANQNYPNPQPFYVDPNGGHQSVPLQQYNQQSVPVVLDNPPNKQKKRKATRKPDEPYVQPHGYTSIPISNMPQMVAHQTPLRMMHAMDQAQMPSYLPFPLSNFNPYGMPFPIFKYDVPNGQTENPYAPFPPSMQNTLPPNLGFMFAEPQRSSQNNTDSRPTYLPTPTATDILSGLSDGSGLKRSIGVRDEPSAFQDYKRQKLITSTDNTSVQYSTNNNDVKEESASSTVKDDEQIDDNNNENKKPSLAYDHFSCILCMETKKDTVLFPCYHLCICQKCSTFVTSCPICRTEFNQTLTVYT